MDTFNTVLILRSCSRGFSQLVERQYSMLFCRLKFELEVPIFLNILAYYCYTFTKKNFLGELHCRITIWRTLILWSTLQWLFLNIWCLVNMETTECKKKKKTHTRLCQENFKGMYRCYLLHKMYQSVIDFVTCRVERKVKSEFLMKRKLRYQL